MAGQPQPIDEDVAAMAFVQSSSLCHGLPEACLEALFSAGLISEYGPSEVVFEESAVQDDLFLLLDGSVSICKHYGEKLIEIIVLERPSVFGETAALTQQPRAASAITRTDTRLVCFPGKVVREVADSAPKFGRRLAALMASRGEEMVLRLAEADS